MSLVYKINQQSKMSNDIYVFVVKNAVYDRMKPFILNIPKTSTINNLKQCILNLLGKARQRTRVS